MVCAIAPICEQKNGVAFAECDSKLLRIMSLLGIKAEIIGDSINYLGSETIPISMSYEGLKDFYFNNKYLVTSQDMDKISSQKQLTKGYNYNVKHA